MTLSEGSGIIINGTDVLKTPIAALDNLSLWQLFIAFLVLDVIAWAAIKVIRGRAMSESAVSAEEQQEIDNEIAFAEMDSVARNEYDSTYD